MTDLGVVDPLRPPASVVALGGRLRMLPPYAIAFLGVFIARALADLYAALRPDGEFAAASILALVLGSIPDWLALLAPVAIGWAVVRFGSASTRVTRGAIAVGLSEIVAMGAPFVGGSEPTTIVATGLVRMVSFVLLAGGLIWLARGLEEVRSNAPSSIARRAALGGVALGVAVAATELFARAAQILSFSGPTGAADEDRAILIANASGLSHVLVLLAWAYLAWVLVRADGDVGRPPQATRLGAVAGWLAIAWLGASLVGLGWLPFASGIDAPSAGLEMLTRILFVVAVAAATIALAAIAALVAGIARGLASPPPVRTQRPTRRQTASLRT